MPGACFAGALSTFGRKVPSPAVAAQDDGKSPSAARTAGFQLPYPEARNPRRFCCFRKHSLRRFCYFWADDVISLLITFHDTETKLDSNIDRIIGRPIIGGSHEQR